MGAKHLLVVGTGRVIQAMIARIIKPLGYDVLSAKTYEDVQELLKNKQAIDIVVVAMDLNEKMPELVKELLSQWIPTILLSDTEEKEVREEILKEDIIDYTSEENAEGLQKLFTIIQRLEKNRGQTVLVVDDSVVFRKYMSNLLKRHLFTTLEAKDGQKGLDILAEHKEIRLIISDYEMPVLDGLALVEEVRKDFTAGQLPIIVVSGIGNNTANVACLNKGANDYLQKPFEREEFFSRIYMTLDNQENIDTLYEQKLLLEDYKSTLDKATIVTMTDIKGKITYASEALIEISGYSKEELLGASHSIIRHPETNEDVYEELWTCITSGKVWKGELKNRKKNGDVFWVETTITPEKDRSGKILGYSAVSHDQTMKKEYEALSQDLEKRVTEELDKNKQQASHMLHQSRLAQMGEMISMIAHQWRQPLASISAIAGTLNVDVQLDEYKKEFFEERLEAIVELSLHLSETINDFRSFFKEDKTQEVVSLKELFDNSFQIIEPSLASKGILVDAKVDKDISFMTYPNEIKQVILNILKNAEEALVDNGVKKGKMAVRSYVKDNMAYLSIQDNAGGIPEDILGKVFDPYFSTKTAKDGTGLGLYMSKTIIEEHCNGHMQVDNIDGGACFSLSFPMEEVTQ